MTRAMCTVVGLITSAHPLKSPSTQQHDPEQRGKKITLEFGSGERGEKRQLE